MDIKSLAIKIKMNVVVTLGPVCMILKEGVGTSVSVLSSQTSYPLRDDFVLNTPKKHIDEIMGINEVISFINILKQVTPEKVNQDAMSVDLDSQAAEMSSGEIPFEGGSELDQLDRIFRVLGTPTNEVWPGVTSLKYWEKNSPQYVRQDLALYVPQLGADGIDLLEKMLVYKPAGRISAKAALNHRYFSSLHRGQFNC
ncbi:hypothetical protein QVD17_40504 [Tagetes erecta]|uniref:Protein kinase domain-containing protein n=1 Tax=Tagetes erecta TaxID=13708 RepID=A0AAD8JRI4_TARER|nr:hypothetical protein QVD17_40504 [Tagetes erecta]